MHPGREDAGRGCISDSNLRAFLLGELPERVGRSIASHLEICPECEVAARRLDGLTDTVIDRLRREFVPGAVRRRDDGRPRRFPSKEPAEDGPWCPAGFEVFEELGRGGMSVVYRARQAYPSRVVAIKFLLGRRTTPTPSRARFLAEADAFARLRHPNIVQIHEVGEHGGLPVPRPGVRRGRHASPTGSAGPRCRPGRPPSWPSRLARAVHARPPAGDRPPRPQAGERPARPPTAPRRSPTSAWPSGWATSRPDAPPGPSSARPLHGARAGRGPGATSRPGGRRLRPRGDPLRDADRPAAVPGGDAAGDARPGPLERAGRPEPAAAEAAPRPRDDLPEVPGEGAGRRVRVGRGLADDLGRFLGGRADPGPAGPGRSASPGAGAAGTRPSPGCSARWRPS